MAHTGVFQTLKDLEENFVATKSLNKRNHHNNCNSHHNHKCGCLKETENKIISTLSAINPEQTIQKNDLLAIVSVIRTFFSKTSIVTNAFKALKNVAVSNSAKNVSAEEKVSHNVVSWLLNSQDVTLSPNEALGKLKFCYRFEKHTKKFQIWVEKPKKNTNYEEEPLQEPNNYYVPNNKNLKKVYLATSPVKFQWSDESFEKKDFLSSSPPHQIANNVENNNAEETINRAGGVQSNNAQGMTRPPSFSNFYEDDDEAFIIKQRNQDDDDDLMHSQLLIAQDDEEDQETEDSEGRGKEKLKLDQITQPDEDDVLFFSPVSTKYLDFLISVFLYQSSLYFEKEKKLLEKMKEKKENSWKIFNDPHMINQILCIKEMCACFWVLSRDDNVILRIFGRWKLIPFVLVSLLRSFVKRMKPMKISSLHDLPLEKRIFDAVNCIISFIGNLTSIQETSSFLSRLSIPLLLKKTIFVFMEYEVIVKKCFVCFRNLSVIREISLSENPAFDSSDASFSRLLSMLYNTDEQPNSNFKKLQQGSTTTKMSETPIYKELVDCLPLILEVMQRYMDSCEILKQGFVILGNFGVKNTCEKKIIGLGGINFLLTFLKTRFLDRTNLSDSQIDSPSNSPIIPISAPKKAQQFEDEFVSHETDENSATMTISHNSPRKRIYSVNDILFLRKSLTALWNLLFCETGKQKFFVEANGISILKGLKNQIDFQREKHSLLLESYDAILAELSSYVELLLFRVIEWIQEVGLGIGTARGDDNNTKISEKEKKSDVNIENDKKTMKFFEIQTPSIEDFELEYMF